MENNNSLNHVVKIVERKNIIISGIKKTKLKKIILKKILNLI